MEKTTVEKAEIKKRKAWPDGKQLEYYETLKCEQWTYTQWAWEFLRRNDNFRKDCRRVQNGTAEEQKAVAIKYDLKSYKFAGDGFGRGSRVPVFRPASVFKRVNLDNDEPTKVDRKLQKGEVAIFFNLEAALNDDKVIAYQLRVAGKILANLLNEYSDNHKKEIKKHNHKPMKFGIYIRLLDLMISGHTPVECAKILYPKKTIGKDSTEIREMVKDQVKAAKQYAAKDYLQLALIKKTPTAKKINFS